MRRKVTVVHTILFVHDVLQSISITDELHLQHIHGFRETTYSMTGASLKLTAQQDIYEHNTQT